MSTPTLDLKAIRERCEAALQELARIGLLTDVPLLCDRVEQLEAENERLRVRVERLAKAFHGYRDDAADSTRLTGRLTSRGDGYDGGSI